MDFLGSWEFLIMAIAPARLKLLSGKKPKLSVSNRKADFKKHFCSLVIKSVESKSDMSLMR
jgi:hypothetical protein